MQDSTNHYRHADQWLGNKPEHPPAAPESNLNLVALFDEQQSRPAGQRPGVAGDAHGAGLIATAGGAAGAALRLPEIMNADRNDVQPQQVRPQQATDRLPILSISAAAGAAAYRASDLQAVPQRNVQPQAPENKKSGDLPGQAQSSEPSANATLPELSLMLAGAASVMLPLAAAKVQSEIGAKIERFDQKNPELAAILDYPGKIAHATPFDKLDAARADAAKETKNQLDQLKLPKISPWMVEITPSIEAQGNIGPVKGSEQMATKISFDVNPVNRLIDSINHRPINQLKQVVDTLDVIADSEIRAKKTAVSGAGYVADGASISAKLILSDPLVEGAANAPNTIANEAHNVVQAAKRQETKAAAEAHALIDAAKPLGHVGPFPTIAGHRVDVGPLTLKGDISAPATIVDNVNQAIDKINSSAPPAARTAVIVADVAFQQGAQKIDEAAASGKQLYNGLGNLSRKTLGGILNRLP